MTIPNPPTNKNELRHVMRALLRKAHAHHEPTRDALDRYLRGFTRSQVIASYFALPGEVDLSPLPLLQPQHQWVYPRINGETLSFHQVRNPSTDLVTGAYDILEPASWLDEIHIHQIDIFLCPGLAFDAQGGRLGRGKGFYDRALARRRSDAKKIGVCFPLQRVADTFSGDHDIPMDLVIDGAQS